MSSPSSDPVRSALPEECPPQIYLFEVITPILNGFPVRGGTLGLWLERTKLSMAFNSGAVT